MKTCRKCNVLKQSDAFRKRSETPDGLDTRCRACKSAIYYENTHKYREQNYQYKYGISIAEYELRLADQLGVCAICSGTCRSGKRLAIDHNHGDGKIRGLLCADCNVGLGRFKDNAELLAAASAYLMERALTAVG